MEHDFAHLKLHLRRFPHFKKCLNVFFILIFGLP